MLRFPTLKGVTVPKLNQIIAVEKGVNLDPSGGFDLSPSVSA
ncbi:hypothetical protein [Actinoplanes sp. NPDC051851]